MATPTDNTRAPARTPIPFIHRPAPPTDDPRTADELLGEIGAEIDRQAGGATPPREEGARPRGRVGRALAEAWRSVEADAEVWRRALGELYGPAPA